MRKILPLFIGALLCFATIAHAETEKYRCPKTKNGEYLSQVQSGTISKGDKKGGVINCIYPTEGNRTQKQIWCKAGETASVSQHKDEDDRYVVEVSCE